jgi:hypothetical protein
MRASAGSRITIIQWRIRALCGLLLLACGLTCVTGSAAVAGPAAAATRPQEGASTAGRAEQLEFDIPSQPLVVALEAYSGASGAQILYDSNLASGRQSAEIKGIFTHEAALQALLAGTGLAARYTDTNDIVLVPVSKEGDITHEARLIDAPTLFLDTLRVEGVQADRRAYNDYAHIVQAEIQRALRENATTRSGSYKIGVKLWVSGSGAVLRSEIFRSTGDDARDREIARTLGAITISKAPPADMPQPVSVVIAAQSL